MSSSTPLTPEELKVDKIVLSWILFTLSDSLQARLVVARPEFAKEAWGLIFDIVKDNKRSRTNALKVIIGALLLRLMLNLGGIALILLREHVVLVILVTMCIMLMHARELQIVGINKGGGTIENSTNELLTKLLQQLGKLVLMPLCRIPLQTLVLLLLSMPVHVLRLAHQSAQLHITHQASLHQPMFNLIIILLGLQVHQSNLFSPPTQQYGGYPVLGQAQPAQYNTTGSAATPGQATRYYFCASYQFTRPNTYGLVQQIIHSLHQEFAMTDLGSLNYFLGIFVTHDSSGMFSSQKKYAVEILERASMVNCDPSRTPVDTESKLGDTCNVVSDPTLYRSLAALKRILRYVCGTLDYGLQLFSSSTTDLVAYSDADWAGCPTTRRSTSGSARAYVALFEKLACQLVGIPETVMKATFKKRLKLALRAAVRVMNPEGLNNAMELAVSIEDNQLFEGVMQSKGVAAIVGQTTSKGDNF
nr:ribonuclease H-like domain-containing protein [Tanacetum cinerariifolium]